MLLIVQNEWIWVLDLKPPLWKCGCYVGMRNFLFILRESKQECEQGGAERVGEKQSQAGPLSEHSPTWGSISHTVRSWPEGKSRSGRLTDWATQVPQYEKSIWKISLHLYYKYLHIKRFLYKRGNTFKLFNHLKFHCWLLIKRWSHPQVNYRKTMR